MQKSDYKIYILGAVVSGLIVAQVLKIMDIRQQL